MNSGTVFVSLAIVSALAGAPVNAGNGQGAASAVVIPSAEIADAVGRLPADPVGDVAL